MIQSWNQNLKEITIPIQAKQGEREFFDIKHRVSYTTHADGSVKRRITSFPHFSVTVTYNPTYQQGLNSKSERIPLWKTKIIKSLMLQ